MEFVLRELVAGRRQKCPQHEIVSEKGLVTLVQMLSCSSACSHSLTRWQGVEVWKIWFFFHNFPFRTCLDSTDYPTTKLDTLLQESLGIPGNVGRSPFRRSIPLGPHQGLQVFADACADQQILWASRCEKIRFGVGNQKTPETEGSFPFFFVRFFLHFFFFTSFFVPPPFFLSFFYRSTFFTRGFQPCLVRKHLFMIALIWGWVTIWLEHWPKTSKW